MKKVKILTFHNAENYGATLQAYALKETLKKIGTEPIFLNYINKYVLKDYTLISTRSLKSFFSSLWYFPRNLKRKNSFKKFVNRYLDGTTERYYNKEEIEKNIKNGEVYVAGSDQIFNPVLTNGLSDIYTLNFGNSNDITKVIYGASVGNEESIEKHKKDFYNKLQSVDMLSLREKGIIHSLEKITGKETRKVIDPTMLLEQDEWNKLIEQNSVINFKKEKYILVYTLFENNEITKIANYLSEKTGCKIIHFRKYNVYNNEKCSLYTRGPVDFVNAFKNAEYVITNSFHGLVFSVIFERKFYVVMPNERAGRLIDLLTSLNLNNRVVKNIDEIINKNINENINFIKAKEIIKIEKDKSIEYLKEGINLK